MRKDLLKNIKKGVNKKNLIGSIYSPTLEECEFLYSQYEIASTKNTIARSGIISNTKYLVDTVNFVKE